MHLAPSGSPGGGGEKLPIGQSFPNERVFLLDGEDHEVTEPNVQGEPVRGLSTALALGYWNAPEQTAKALVPDPLNPTIRRLFTVPAIWPSTGSDGLLSFAGRKDFQDQAYGSPHRAGGDRDCGQLPEAGVSCCCVYDQERSRITAFYVGAPEPRELKKKPL